MIKKIIYIALGAIAFGFGTLGIWVPGLPTTPLYLLAAWLWSRSSERLNNYLLSRPAYQKYVQRPFIERKMQPKSLLKMHIGVGAMMLISTLLVRQTWFSLMMAFLFVGHIVGMRWYFRDMLRAPVAEEAE
ncbi:DUF454 domain-containing protein [Periweissella cryptocerci]|uniref:DUF454 domain-containing protein n=1 Tax=Periweissella cryptocerci TaxID=2506420 RepID=A0A4P6YTS5_9LACO|nr:YbaN family protein [Periweissella cryptocerci]QBO36164.1 DUF454 domain-containing protein [Periweissella cryptocerci]